MEKIIPAALQERGFKHKGAGISGADMWQGMAFWVNKEKGIILRGNISTARGGILHLSGYFNCQLTNLQELDLLLSLWK